MIVEKITSDKKIWFETILAVELNLNLEMTGLGTGVALIGYGIGSELFDLGIVKIQVSVF